MILTRRCFLAVSAAALAVPGPVEAATWSGIAFGADVSLTIRAPREAATAALAEARRIIEEVEALFSLYREDSALVCLNRAGRLADPDLRVVDLMRASDKVHGLTGGRFDPTIQPLWDALAFGGDLAAAEAAIGWDRVAFDARAVVLAPGQALTFNGIAQGYVTDLVAEALEAMGLDDILVNIGEYRALGGPWRIGLSDPGQGVMGFQTLASGAVATSSPAAMSLGARAHILHPGFAPLWSTVSVSADSATVADGLSTALCLAPLALIEEVASLPEVSAIRLVDLEGDLITIRG